MKLFIVSSEIFWGSLLILIGISMIIKTVFGIDIPIIRTLLALFLIYVGFSLITDMGKKKNTISFDQRTIRPEYSDNHYKIRFGKGVIDLTHFENLDEIRHVSVEVMFGEGIIKLPENTPILLTVHPSFGNAVLPDGSEISSGTYTYKANQELPDNPLHVDASVSFGSLKIIQK